MRNCRILFTGLAFHLTLLSAQAQMMFGAKGGYTSATVHLDKDISTSYWIYPYTGHGQGFNVGFFMRSSNSSRFAFRAELLYSSRTVVVDYGVGPGFMASKVSGTVSGSLGYLTVPLIFAPQVAKGLDLQVGLAPSFLLHSNITDRTTTYGWDGEVTEVIDPLQGGDLEQIIVDLYAGLSYDLTHGLHLSARYVMDLGNILRSSNDYMEFSMLELSVGYCFAGRRPS